MKAMTVADVGCYDGWLIHQLSDLPFRRLVGIEPREKNIRKGQVARRLLGVESRVEFRLGALDSLPDERFDIVIAAGLLHHVEAPVQALRSLRRICGRLLFAETIILDSRHCSEEVRREVEPKDVVYYGRAKSCGLSGQKLESAYYDGSSTALSLVSIPTWETIELACEAAGFAAPVEQVRPEEYRKAVWGAKRPCLAAIFTAEPAADSRLDFAGQTEGAKYEAALAATVLDLEDLTPLFQEFVSGERPRKPTAVSAAASQIIRGAPVTEKPQALDALGLSPEASEILKNLAHAPADKIRLELGKALLAGGNLTEAENQFLAITRRWNADWRSVYRAFHYLSAISGRRGDAAGEAHYLELLSVANANFPKDAWPRGGAAHV
jgi:SAM-dependent methyltransferase